MKTQVPQQVSIPTRRIHNLKMYFVVFLLQTKKHYVVPYRWIQGINYENIFNYGLNRNLKFHTFWTEDKNAFDEHDVPKKDYTPDLNAHGQVFPAAGWYLCHIRKFKGMFLFKNYPLVYLSQFYNLIYYIYGIFYSQTCRSYHIQKSTSKCSSRGI